MDIIQINSKVKFTVHVSDDIIVYSPGLYNSVMKLSGQNMSLKQEGYVNSHT